MIDTSRQRVKISQVIENQLPEFVQAESPLFVDFMKQYYISQEYQGGPVDVAENLDRYNKLQTFVGAALTEYTGLSTDTQSYSDTIFVETTKGWPDKYGLLKIDDEIITYTGIGATSFTGCIRGFSGVDSLDRATRPDLVSFQSTVGAAHTGGTKVFNLSNLFIQEFFNKLKTTFANGFQNRTLDGSIDEVQFIRQIKDFYRTKGTEEAYKILFKVLFGSEVNIIKPSDFLLKPSDGDYSFTQDFVAKLVTGDPRALKGSTLFQDTDADDKTIPGASGAISDVKEFMYDGERYYQISLTEESIQGNFVIPGRTRLTDSVSIGATVITVDTTVGFPTSGTLNLVQNDIVGVTSYTGKTSNQFLGITTTPQTYSVSDEVRYGNVAYGYSAGNISKKIEVLITGVLGGFDVPEDTYYFNKGDRIRVGNLGVMKVSQDQSFNSWIHNTAVKHAPISFIRISSDSFSVSTAADNDFLQKDTIEVLNSDSEIIGTGKITSVVSNGTFVLGELPGIDPSNVTFIRRRVLRGNSTVHENITKYTTDVQNTYDHESGKKNPKPPHPHVYTTSPSIPSLGQEPITVSDRSITWTGVTGGNTIQLIQVTDGAKDHGFYSGEVVTFNIIEGSLGDLQNGKNYFIKRVSSNEVQLANSLPDLVNGTFVTAIGSGTFKLSVPDLANKKLEHQKLIKRFPLNPSFNGRQQDTPTGTTGMLINGTEISNYKSGDEIFFGGIKSIDVLEGGTGYDVIVPPTVTISASAGAGASATANVRGSFERIDIIDPGFDYVEQPSVEISGGNGSGAVARTILKQVDHSIDFDASATSNRISISNDTIGFSTYHKFRDGEAVIYRTFGNTAVGIASTAGVTGIQVSPDRRLIDKSVYFVARINPSTIKLANNENDALTRSNLLNFTAFGDGIQRFESLRKKQVIGRIVIENPGEGYENKRRLVPTSGINTYSDFIEYKDHGFNDGDLIRYSNEGVRIGGLETTQDYYVLREDGDKFRLAAAGIGSTLSRANYDTKQYVGMTSVGEGKHIFNYPPITVAVRGKLGINTDTTENYHAITSPIVRGGITAINVEEPGVGYGSSDVFNFSIPPEVRVSSGSSSEYKAIVQNGKIQSVIVTSAGTEYTSAPDLTIFGDGVGAKVIASISNGSIDKITVTNGGVGYSTSQVVVSEQLPGSGVKFLTKVNDWQINNVKRYEDIIQPDDGFLIRGDNDNGMKFTSFYAPRELRKLIQQKNSDGTKDYAQSDLNVVNNAEEGSTKHSPIIGWAYDGNPIYGPYGYDRKDGGIARPMRSGYVLKTSRENGPPIGQFPLGFFIKDYEYQGNGDLDRNNGRFCITPDYPNGTYAYFATINPTENETSGTFKNFRAPQFPYLIGDKYAADIDPWNFVETNGQDFRDLNSLDLRRNTYPYKLSKPGASYEGVYQSRDRVLQETVVNYSTSSGIEDYIIESAGTGYKVNDLLRVVSNDSGNGYSAKISQVSGKDIVSIASTVAKVENIVFEYDNFKARVVGFATEPHGLSVGDVVTVSGLSTDSLRRLDGRHTIGFSTAFLLLSTGIGTTGSTGIVTDLHVSGNLGPDNITPDDIIGISTEQMLVMNIDNLNNTIRVKREFDGVLGTGHSGTSLITVLNRKIQFNVGLNTNIVTNRNTSRYFNPTESLALGNTAGVGIGSTIFYTLGAPGGIATSRFIPTQNIYAPGHGFVNGQKLLYSSDGDTSIQVYNGISTFNLPNNSFVFAINDGKDLLGISTNPLGIGSTGAVTGIGSTAYKLFFTGYGSGKVHSFKPQKDEITGFVEKVVGTVVCKEPHGLIANDRVIMSVTPGISSSYYVKYDDITKRTIINPKNFGSAGINTNTDTITIQDHGFVTGEKILYSSTNPALPLVDKENYFVVRIDKNTFKLAETYYKANLTIPQVVGITSVGNNHEIGLINPLLNLTRGYKVGFAVSDTSLGQTVAGKRRKVFDFELFGDKNFTKPYFLNTNDGSFQVVGVGTVGVTTTARVDFSVTQDTPTQLFYRLNPVNLNIISADKNNPVTDNDVINAASIKIRESGYNGTFTVSGVGSTSFSFNIPTLPERDGYTSDEATTLKYDTTATQVSGPIEQLQVISKGKGYRVLPTVTSIGSTSGVGGIIKLSSRNLGALKTTTIKNIGFDYSPDKTLEPEVQLPQIMRLNRLSTIDSIGVSSGGRNYTGGPGLVLIDRVTGRVNPDTRFETETQGTSVSQVNILINTSGLYDTDPRLVPVNNSNGVKVSDATINSSTNIVTLTLDGTYTEDTYPFFVGGEIFVENIGIASTGSGYNSSDYGYDYFTVTGVSTNAGGGGATVSYQLDSSVTNAGIFSGGSSSGSVARAEDLAIFEVKVKPNNFSENEIISTGDKRGTVVTWNDKNKYLKVVSDDVFNVGDVINGLSSKSAAIITEINRYSSKFNITPFSEVRNGWQRETGKLNNELQKVQDSDYYQTFSYSLESDIEYEKWKNPVNSLNHVVGFKNFSDLSLVSVAGTDSKNRSNARVGVSSAVATVKTDLVSETESIHNTYDFDLVTENSKTVNGALTSDVINFSNKILTDYIESRTNRAISIDSVSSQFNDLPRATAFSDIADFNLDVVRGGKFYIMAFDRRFSGEKQILQMNVLHDGTNGFLMPFGRVETTIDLGEFDFSISGNVGNIRFLPAKSKNNNYAIRIFSQQMFNNTTTAGIGSTDVGTGYKIVSTSTGIGSTDPSPVQVVGFNTTTTTTSKLFVLTNELGGQERSQLNELVVHQDGSEVYVLEYGQMLNDNISGTNAPSVGLGTFGADITSGITTVHFTPVTGVGVTMRVHQTSIDSSATGIGSTLVSLTQVLTSTTSIGATATPQATRISGFQSSTYQAADCLIEINDTTNDRSAVTQVTLIHDGTDIFFSEFGSFDTFNGSGIGTIGVGYSSTSGGDLELRLTPPANTAVTTKVFQYNFTETGTGGVGFVTFTNSELRSQEGTYTGTDNDIKFSFPLKHRGDSVFHKVFDASDAGSVDVTNDTLIINNHFFTTGEELTYTPTGAGTTMSIGITTATIVGFGTTDKLPSTVYAVKIAENKFKVSASATDALAVVPVTLDINAVGVGTTHAFTSKNLNSKMLVTLDNNIQSPVIQSPVNTALSFDVLTTTDFVTLAGVSSFFSGDVIKINDEFMKIDTVGIGSTNQMLVKRAQLNSALANHTAGATVTKFIGNYQVVEDTINFTDAPKGEKGPVGLTTTSTFVGRAFTRTGVPQGSQDAYANNYVFDDVSNQFTGVATAFVLQSNGQNVTGVATNNGVILINEIFQNPASPDDYIISETAGITSIRFTGAGVSVSYDVNSSSIPRGGVIVSVGETSSFGYQPLVAAGGTAIVSAAGTVESVSIGNSGSGYRVGVQTNILVKAIGSSGIVTVGRANVSAGLVTSVTIINGGGSGFTSATPPTLEFEPPLNYENMRLVGSNSGIGASVSVRVGSATSVISFNITNYGYNYKIGDVLELATDNQAGIPTDASAGAAFTSFRLTVDNVFNDSFGGWTFGEIEKLNTFEDQFDGVKRSFALTKTIGASATPLTLRAAKGSPIKVEDNMLVFLNDILQIPSESYVMNGGAQITFSEAPKFGDKVRIYYYRGSDNDVIEVDILETVKAGDSLTINKYPDFGVDSRFQQVNRIVTGITTSDSVTTNTYQGIGISTDPTLERPVTWKKQLSDVFVNNTAVTKDRTELEAGIRPTAYILNNVGASSTEVFVDSAVPLFNEVDDFVESKQSVLILDRTVKTGAAATAIVSAGGTITSIVISDGGSGYTSAPSVSIGVTAGIGTIFAGIGITINTNATATSTISGVGTVSAITVSDAGIGYTNTNPPGVLIAPEAQTDDTLSSVKYEGDFGIITGIGTTSVVGIATTGLTFDLFIPLDSTLRDSSVMSTPITNSGIQTGYYFVVSNSYTGTGITAYGDASGASPVGIGTSFIDNIYKVMAVENVTGSAIGVGETTLRRVTVSVSSTIGVSLGSSERFGQYSWGRLHDFVRSDAKAFTAITDDGVTGIITGPVIVRTRDLKESYI